MNEEHDKPVLEPDELPAHHAEPATEGARPDQEGAQPPVEDLLPDVPTEPNVMLPDGMEDGEESFALQEGLTPLVGPAPVEIKTSSTNPLPSLQDSLMRPTRRLYFGTARDIGMVRTSNEDSTLVFHSVQQNVQDNPVFSLFLVADGAGGHLDGEHASLVVGRVMLKSISEQIYLPMLLQNINPATAEPLAPITEVLVEACLEADRVVRAEVPGGGTTLTAAVIIGDLAHIVHVGDSRAYLITQAEDGPDVQQLTRDHSVAKRLQEIGQITASEATRHPEASRLWKIMGLTEHLEPDINTRRLPANCHLVLCSDGLWNMVPEDTIVEIVTGAASPQEAANRLVNAANANGGVDNISVVVVRVP